MSAPDFEPGGSYYPRPVDRCADCFGDVADSVDERSIDQLRARVRELEHEAEGDNNRHAVLESEIERLRARVRQLEAEHVARNREEEQQEDLKYRLICSRAEAAELEERCRRAEASHAAELARVRELYATLRGPSGVAE